MLTEPPAQCDLQRPVCGQCQKARIQCFGYERQWIFVNVTTPPLEGQEVAARKSTPSVPLLRDSLAQSALEEKYLGQFWDMYLPKGAESSKLLPKYSLGNWIPAMLDLYKTDPALHKSLMALSMGTIGRRQGIQQLTEQSLRFYYGAISDMNVGLKSSSRGKSDALLLSTRTLGLYEVRQLFPGHRNISSYSRGTAYLRTPRHGGLQHLLGHKLAGA